MDYKQAIFGVAIIVASVGGSAIVGGKTDTRAVPVTQAAADVVAATIANLGNDIMARKHCEPQREGTDKGVILTWVCNGARVPDADQAELNKLGGETASAIDFEPSEVDGKVVLKPTITTGGVLPNLDPVPVPEEPKPAEELKDAKLP